MDEMDYRVAVKGKSEHRVIKCRDDKNAQDVYRLHKRDHSGDLDRAKRPADHYEVDITEIPEMKTGKDI